MPLNFAVTYLSTPCTVGCCAYGEAFISRRKYRKKYEREIKSVINKTKQSKKKRKKKSPKNAAYIFDILQARTYMYVSKKGRQEGLNE